MQALRFCTATQACTKPHVELRPLSGTQLDQYWTYHKAMATNDREFAHQLFTELKDNSGPPLSVDKQMFEAAVKSFEKSKN